MQTAKVFNLIIDILTRQRFYYKQILLTQSKYQFKGIQLKLNNAKSNSQVLLWEMLNRLFSELKFVMNYKQETKLLELVTLGNIPWIQTEP